MYIRTDTKVLFLEPFSSLSVPPKVEHVLRHSFPFFFSSIIKDTCVHNIQQLRGNRGV